MKEQFKEPVFREVSYDPGINTGNLIKSSNANMIGKTKITVEEDGHESVKVILKKDQDDSIKEIKFICSCGQTKTIVLDYSAE
ncbi:MAG: hypothetical protein M0P61_05175 [Ignavibacteriaceae bacterium]|jgi:hypothetical protein|nr:hypothetical protein [Ignavibacteriaceae bacterium]